MTHSNSGPSLPASVMAAGRDACDSYASFFDGRPIACASNYRSVSRRFFVWADSRGLTLDGIGPDHVRQFHRQLYEEAGPASAQNSLSIIRRLCEHMHADGALACNPARDISTRRFPEFRRVERAFREQWKGDATDEVTRAAMVMVAPAALATFSLKAIRSWTQYPMETVECLASRLYATGIWWKDDAREGLRCEWIDPECEARDFAILLDAFVVVGIFARDDQLRYSLPEEAARTRQAGPESRRRAVKRTVREETREFVTVREASEVVIEE